MPLFQSADFVLGSSCPARDFIAQPVSLLGRAMRQRVVGEREVRHRKGWLVKVSLATLHLPSVPSR